MAAKQQAKRKAGALKRKKLQKKYQHIRKNKLQDRKQRKFPSCLEHGVKEPLARNTVSSKVVRICSPKLFTSKMVREVLKAYIEVKAKGMVKNLLTDVYNHVATEIDRLSQKSPSATISCTDVQTALKEAVVRELVNHTSEPLRNECA